jgi:hypothetical protein
MVEIGYCFHHRVVDKQGKDTLRKADKVDSKQDRSKVC